MKPLDYILIAAVAVIVGLAIFFTIKNRMINRESSGFYLYVL